MTNAITKGNLFKPSPSRLETKAENTNTTARAMIDAETASREEKTARLREARLEKEAREDMQRPEQPSKKTSLRRRGKS